MKTAQLNFNSKYALICYEKAILEFYNPEVWEESDDLHFLEDKMFDFEGSFGCTKGFTIITKDDSGNIIGEYSREIFQLNQY